MSKKVHIDNSAGPAHNSPHLLTTVRSLRAFGKFIRPLIIVCLGVSLFLFANSGAIADTVVTPGSNFPGKGDYKTWLNANVFYDQGNRSLDAGNYADAVEKYKKAISMYSFDAAYYSNLGLAYKKVGDRVSAEKYFRKSLSLKESWDTWANLAHVLKSQGRKTECRDALRKAIAAKPPDPISTKLKKELSEVE